MKYLSIIFLFVFGVKSYAQNIEELTKPIIEEGKRLYRSEMTSWYGTDLFLEKYTNREDIGGFFSYSENEENICVIFSKSKKPKIIGTINFDNSFELAKANINLEERNLTNSENEIYTIRQKALEIIQNDTFFKIYENMGFNLIPLIDKKENKVYVLTGPTKHGVVVFGNDYLITFDKKNNLKSTKSLHKNIIPIEYEEGDEIKKTMHTHLPEEGDFIIATDICTLMLYGKSTGWRQHNVVSQKYLNIWNIKTNDLIVLTIEGLKKIDENQQQRKENSCK